ncbi:MAG: hypothetical protein IJ906_04895 [Oscillospiraceae bacterium]|nr:hypothetical protein [Oscillospiraceae bacterium]
MKRLLTAAVLSLGLLLPAMPVSAAEAPAKAVCENEKLRLWYDADKQLLGLENRESGYIWWSSPLGCEDDPRATKPIITDLQSSAVLLSGDSTNRKTNVLRSGDAAVITAKERPDGVELTYRFTQCGVTVPVTCTLEDDHMTVRTETAQITEEKADQGIFAAQLTLLGNFGAAGADEQGCFVIPDGCGALIHFNNGKEKTKSYTAKVYGRDLTAVPTTKPPVTEKVLLPVFGIVREDGNAMTVIADEGSDNVTLNAEVSGQSLSSYNRCNFTFTLRGSDSYYMAGTYGTLTVFEQGVIKPEAVSLRYYPTSGKKADFTDIAATYRSYLVTEKGLTEKAQTGSISMHLDLWGGTMKQRSVLGIPVSRKTALTTYAQAQEIAETLHDAGAENLALVYHNWTDAGISGKVDAKAEPASVLGGGAAFRKLDKYLAENGGRLYPAAENTTFRSGGGYSGFFDTAVRISGAYSRQAEYGLVYGTQTTKTPRSLLSPARFRSIYGKLAKGYSARKLTGISPVSLTSSLWGDYGKQSMGRCDSADAALDSLQALHDKSLDIYAPECAAYALPCADCIGDTPLQSSGFDVFDEEIPFYQTVLHGLIPYASTPINASADTDAAFLTSLAYGCEPSYTMIAAQASELKDTDLDGLYYAHAGYWTDRAAAQYRIAQAVLGKVSGQTITGYTRSGDRSVTTFADGTTLEIDYTSKTVTAGGETYALHTDERSTP